MKLELFSYLYFIFINISLNRAEPTEVLFFHGDRLHSHFPSADGHSENPPDGRVLSDSYSMSTAALTELDLSLNIPAGPQPQHSCWTSASTFLLDLSLNIPAGPQPQHSCCWTSDRKHHEGTGRWLGRGGQSG